MCNASILSALDGREIWTNLSWVLHKQVALSCTWPGSSLCDKYTPASRKDTTSAALTLDPLLTTRVCHSAELNAVSSRAIDGV